MRSLHPQENTIAIGRSPANRANATQAGVHIRDVQAPGPHLARHIRPPQSPKAPERHHRRPSCARGEGARTVAWLCGSRGGTKELPRSQPAPRLCKKPPPPPQRRPQTGNLGGLPSRQIPKPRSAGACARRKGQGSTMNTSCARDSGTATSPPTVASTNLQAKHHQRTGLRSISLDRQRLHHDTDQCPAAQIRRAMPRSRPGSPLSTPALMAAASRELARPADKPAADKLCSTVSCNKNTSLPKSFRGHIYLMCTLSHGNVFRIEFGLKFRVSPPILLHTLAPSVLMRVAHRTLGNIRIFFASTLYFDAHILMGRTLF